MFTCHIWSHVKQLDFQGAVTAATVPSINGPTKIQPGYCPFILGLVKGNVTLHCTDGTDVTVPIQGGTASVVNTNIIILHAVSMPKNHMPQEKKS